MLNRVTNWGEIKQQIAFDDQGKHDITVPIDHVRMNDTGEIFNRILSQSDSGVFNIGATQVPGALRPNEHALGQLFGRVGIPAQYGRKVYNEAPAMIADHVNYWLEMYKLPGMEDGDTLEGRNWLLRAKNNMMRAVLTDSYTQLDNEFAFSALGSALEDGTAVKLQGMMLDDRYLNSRMTFPDMKVNLGTIQKPDWVFVGLHFKNSEVGCSSIVIDACLWRQVCSNGMIVRVKDSETDLASAFLQQRHSRIGRNELQNRVADAIGKAIQGGDSAIDAFARSREIKVESPLEVIKRLSKNQKYSQAFTDSVQNSFQSEPGETAFNVANAFTHAAQNLPIERRLEVETFAGNWMQGVKDKTHVGV
jgi:hypothetical protein